MNETWILKDQEDFNAFFRMELWAKKKFPIRLFHYAIMNTHFHYVLQAIDKETLSAHFAYLKWHYTKWVREKYGWKGPLWRERYKSIPIENESYLSTCGSYVEYNPVRAGICNRPEDYPFSSSRKYRANANDPLLDEYRGGSRQDADNGKIYKTEYSKGIFSRSCAIGSPFYVAKHQPRMNACPR
ncbi:MAG: transposase [Candidatus Omnitrophica bacterium]|nr:transposase [Candidatus Omnitrophota bacterium]